MQFISAPHRFSVMVRGSRAAVAPLVLVGLAVLPACGGSGGSAGSGGSRGSVAGPGVVFITGSGATGVSGVSGDTGFVPGAVGLFQVNGQTYRVHQIGYIRT